jgi:hypothetical protein
MNWWQKMLVEIAKVILAALIAYSGLKVTGCAYTSTLTPINGSLTVTTQPR